MTATLKLTNGDVSFSSATGRPFLLTGTDKFKQDIRENLDSAQQTDGTGAGLEDLIGLLGDPFSLRAEMNNRLTVAFEAYKKLQQSIQRSDRTPEERFGQLRTLTVVPLASILSPVLTTSFVNTGEVSKTSLAFRVDVLSAAKTTPTTVTGTITI